MGHPWKLTLFVLLSLADLGLTYWLLNCPSGVIYEANPVARSFLAYLGWAGLASYKAAAVAVVLAVASLIARSRPASAGRVLALGCAVTGLVVLYSAGLVRVALASEAQAQRDQGELEVANQEVQAATQRRGAFFTRLADDLAKGRCTLREASDRLTNSELGQDARWRASATYSNFVRPFPEVAALVAMRHALNSLRERPLDAWRLSERLQRDYRITFGTESPLAHEEYRVETGEEEAATGA